MGRKKGKTSGSVPAIQNNGPGGESPSEQLAGLTQSLQSLTRDLERLANHVCRRRRWYQRIGIRDVTIIVGLFAFMFTAFEFRDTYTKFQQRRRMVQSIANTALRLSQDLAFRPEGAEVKEGVIDSLLVDARQLAPQDPDLLSVQIYSQFMRKARSPTQKDLMSMDAYLNYVNRLRKIEDERPLSARLFEIRNDQIITPGRFLQKLYYVGAAAFLNYIDSNTPIDPNTPKVDLASLLIAKADEYISTGIKVSQEEKDDIYESILLALRVEFGLKMIDRGVDYHAEIEHALATADNLFSQFKQDSNRERQLTGYDGAANICYLRAQYLHRKGKTSETIQMLDESLRRYDQVASLFPGRINSAEVTRVKNYRESLSPGK